MLATEIREKLSKLESAIQFGSSDAGRMLIDAKIALTNLPALQPGAEVNDSHLSEIALARNVYEIATLLSVKEADEAGFERHVAQAKTYYVDYAKALKPSERQNLILGLNLLRLMAQNRIAEFHTELELVPPESRSDQYIDYALRLEHYLMEGSYSKIREEKNAMPDPIFAHFVDMLMVTVREEIAACCERAYDRLPFEAAKRMLSFDTDEEMVDFNEQRNWNVEKGTILFGSNVEDESSLENVPSAELIRRSLLYARELEQII